MGAIRFTMMEWVLVYSILSLVAIVALLLVYAVTLHMRHMITDQHGRAIEHAWETILYEYLDGTRRYVDGSTLALNPRDWLLFGRFIERYLLDLKGEDNERIIRFLWGVRFYEVLLENLRSRHAWEKAYSIHYLSLMRYTPARTMMIELIHDRSLIVSVKASEAVSLLGLGGDQSAELLAIFSNRHLDLTTLADIMGNLGRGMYPLVVSLLKKPGVDDAVRRRIVDVSASLEMVEAVDLIIAIGGSTRDDELRIGCVKACGILQDPVSIPFLRGQLASPHVVIRGQAARSLGRLGASDAVDELVGCATGDGDASVRYFCVEALHAIGGRGMPALKDAAGADPDGDLDAMIAAVVDEGKGA